MPTRRTKRTGSCSTPGSRPSSCMAPPRRRRRGRGSTTLPLPRLSAEILSSCRTSVRVHRDPCGHPPAMDEVESSDAYAVVGRLQSNTGEATVRLSDTRFGGSLLSEACSPLLREGVGLVGSVAEEAPGLVDA